MDRRNSIGPVIRAERERRCWSLQRLASDAGISLNGLWLIETGKVKPHGSTLLKLARALAMDLGSVGEAA